MPSQQFKTKKAAQGSAISADSDELPEIDLITFDEPAAVDLGDFDSVWKHIATLPPNAPFPPADTPAIPEHVPASRKQLRKKPVVSRSATNNVSAKRNTTTTPSTIAHPTQDRRVRSEPPDAEPPKKSMPAFTYSSFEDDGDDDSSWYSSSYEDKRNPLSQRHKSFLYVPPTFTSPLIPTKPAPPAPVSAAERRRTAIEKLISKYPDQINQIIPPQPLSRSSSPYLSSLAATESTDLHIFIDNSNILIGFYDAYKSQHKITDPFFRSPKFDFHTFSTIIERGRPVSRKILVGSNPLIQPVALAQHLGYEVSILERVVDTSKRPTITSPYSSDSATRTPREKKKEQAVDEILHLKILECLLDVETPATIVLATGDAAPAEFSRQGGFLKCIQRALTRGWHVELVCWRKSMSRLWRDKIFRIQWRDTFSVVELDDFVDELVLE